MSTNASLSNVFKGNDNAPIVEKIIGLESASHTTDTTTSVIGIQDRNFEPVLYAGTMRMGTPSLQIAVESADIVSESALTITDPSDVVENVVFFNEVGSYLTLRGIQYDTTSNVGSATISWLWDGTPFSLIVNVS